MILCRGGKEGELVFVKPCSEVEAAATARLQGVHVVAQTMSTALATLEECLIWANVEEREHLPSAPYMIVSKHPGNGFILGNAWVRKKRSKKEQALVVTNLVLGIRFIHERGVTHNDLHSGNWLVGPNSEIRFIDFDRATIRCGPTEFNTVVYDPDHDLCELIWHALNTLNLCRSVRRAIRRACGCEHVVLPCLEGSDQITGWWGHSDVLGSLADWKLHDMNTPFHPKSPRVLTRYSNNYPMYPKLVIEDNPGANPGVFLGLAVDFHDFEASRSPGRPPQASFVDEGAILDALGFFLTHGRFP